jgi:transcription-repair coupling factor (superfamily II helicase)
VTSPASPTQAPSLRALAQLVATDPTLAEAVAAARGSEVMTLDLTAPQALRPFAVAALAAEQEHGGAGRPVLAVTATAREAEDLVAALESILDAEAAVLYPAWETLPHERLSPRSDTVGRRLAVLRRLVHPDEPGMPAGPIRVVVAPVRSVLQPQVRGLADLQPVSLQVGDEVDLEDVVRRLADAAYHRVDLVERRGEFAVRGGIVDVSTSPSCSTSCRRSGTVPAGSTAPGSRWPASRWAGPPPWRPW